MKTARSLFWFGMVLGLTSMAQAAGLSTEFGEVRLQDLRIDRRYSFSELTGSPFRVENTSLEESVTLRIEVLAPQPSELKPGFEAIPEVSWLTLDRSEFTLGPKESALTDLMIVIPKDPALQGRGFQVYLWVHTTGGNLGVGLRSRVLMEIGFGQSGDEKQKEG